MTTSSLDVADEDQFFFTRADNDTELEEQTLQRKEGFRQDAIEWVASKELPTSRTNVKDFKKIDGNTTSYSIIEIKGNVRIRVEQGDVDPGLKNLKLKLLGQPHDEVLLTRDRMYKHYKTNENRINLRDCLWFQKYYGKTNSVNY